MEHDKKTKAVQTGMMNGRGPGGRASLMAQKVRAKNIKGTLKRIWQYISAQKAWLFLAFALVLLSTLLGLIGPYFIALGIDNFISKGISEGFFKLLGIMTGVYVVAAIVTYIQQYILVGISQKVIRNMRKDYFDRLMRYSLKFFDKVPNGELMSRLTNDIENVNTTLSNSIAQMFSSLLSFCGVIVIMLVLNWQLALISMTTVPLILWVVKFITKNTRASYREQQSNLGKLNGIIEETLTGQKVVKVDMMASNGIIHGIDGVITENL
jgi:ATP-binding cassette subfamily B protein